MPVIFKNLVMVNEIPDYRHTDRGSARYMVKVCQSEAPFILKRPLILQHLLLSDGVW